MFDVEATNLKVFDWSSPVPNIIESTSSDNEDGVQISPAAFEDDKMTHEASTSISNTEFSSSKNLSNVDGCCLKNIDLHDEPNENPFDQFVSIFCNNCIKSNL